MSKIKTFEMELINLETEEMETVVARKFISTGDLYDLADKAELLESDDVSFKESLDASKDIIMSVFEGAKTKNGDLVTDEIIKTRLSSDDFMETAQNIIMLATGQDPKALPPELQ